MELYAKRSVIMRDLTKLKNAGYIERTTVGGHEFYSIAEVDIERVVESLVDDIVQEEIMKILY